MTKDIRAGLISGAIAGMVMSLAMMSMMMANGKSPWMMPNLISAMWLGPQAAGGQAGWSTILGFSTHLVTSMVMGLVAVPFIKDLSPVRTLLASISYAVASYPVVFAAVLTWANPLMVEKAPLVPMTIGHAIFGLTLGASFLWLKRQ